jgi:hypothetical protein
LWRRVLCKNLTGRKHDKSDHCCCEFDHRISLFLM